MKDEGYHQTVSVYPRAEHTIRARRGGESITEPYIAGKFGPGADVTSQRSNLPTGQGADPSDTGADELSTGPNRAGLQPRAAHGIPRTQPSYGQAPASSPSGSKPTAAPAGMPIAAPQHTGLEAVQMSLQDMLAAAARIQNEFLTSSSVSRAAQQELPRAAPRGMEQPSALTAAVSLAQPRAGAPPQNRGPLEALRDELFADLTFTGPGPAATAPAAPPAGANSSAGTTSQSPVTLRTSWNNDEPGTTALQSVAIPTEQGTSPQLQEELSTTLTAQAGHSYADLSSIYSIPDSTLNAAARTPMSFTTAAVSELDTPSSARSRDEEYDKSFTSPRNSPERTGRPGSGRRLASSRTEYDRIASGYDDYVSPASWMSLREQHSTSHARATSTMSAPGFGGGGDGGGSVTSSPTGPSAWASSGIDLVGSTSTTAPPPPPVSPVASMSSVTYAATDTDAAPTPKARLEGPLGRHPSRRGAEQHHQHQPEQTLSGWPLPWTGARPDILGLAAAPPLSVPSDNSLGAAAASSPSSGGPPTATGFGSIVITAGPGSSHGRERTSSGQLYRTVSFGMPSGATSVISSGTGSRSGEDGAGGATGVNVGASQPGSGQTLSHRISAVARTASVGPSGATAASRPDSEHGGGPGARYGDDAQRRYAEITFTNPLFVRDGESSHGGLEGSSMGGGGTSSSADGSAPTRSSGKGMPAAATPPPSAREGAQVGETPDAEQAAVMEGEPARRGVKRGMGLDPPLATAAAVRISGQTSLGVSSADTAGRRLTRTNSGTAAASQTATDIAGLSSTTSGTDTDGNGHLPPLDRGRPPSVTATLVPASPPPAAIGRTLATATAPRPPSPPLGTSQSGIGGPAAPAEPAQLLMAPGLGVSAATLIAVPEQDRGELVRSWAQVRADFAARPQGSGSQGGATSSTPLTPETSTSGIAAAAGLVGTGQGDASETEHLAEAAGAPGPVQHPEAVPLARQHTVPQRPVDSSPTAMSAKAHPVSVRAVTAAGAGGVGLESGSSTLQRRQPHASDPTPPGGNQLDRLLSLLSGRGARSEGHDQLLLSDTLRSAVFEAVALPRPNSAPVLVSFETAAAAATNGHEVSGKVPPQPRRGPHLAVAMRGLDMAGELGASAGRDAEDPGMRSLGRGSVGSRLPEHPHPHRQPHLPLKPHSHSSLLQITQQQQTGGEARAPAQAAQPSVPQAQSSARAQSTSPSGSLGSIDSELAAERLKAKMRAYLQSAETTAATHMAQAGQGDLALEISSEASSASALAVGVQQPRQHPFLQEQTREAPGHAALADGSMAAAAAAADMEFAALKAGQADLAVLNAPSLDVLLRRAAQHLQAATDPAAAATGAVHTSLVALEDILTQLQLLARSNSAGSGGGLLAVAAGPAALPPRPPAVVFAAEVKSADDGAAGDEANQPRSSGGGGSGEGGGSISVGGFGRATGSVGGFSGTSAGSTGRGGEWSGEGQRMASSVGSVSLWAGSAGTGSTTAAAPSRGSRAVSSPSRLGLQAAGARPPAAAPSSYDLPYPGPPQPAETSPRAPHPPAYPPLYPAGPYYDAPPANRRSGAPVADRRKAVNQDRPERIRRWAQSPTRASAPAEFLNARGGGEDFFEADGGAAEGGASYLELASHAAKLREQMEEEVRQSPPRPTRQLGGLDAAAAQRLLLSPPYSDVVADDLPHPHQAGRRHSQPSGSPQGWTLPVNAAHTSYDQHHQPQDWHPGYRSVSQSGEAAAVGSRPSGPVDWQAALQSKLMPFDAVRDRDMLIAAEELPAGLYAADAAPAAGAGHVTGDRIHRGARNSSGGRQGSRPASPRAVGAHSRTRPSSARASAPSAAAGSTLRSAPVTPRRGNSPARSPGAAAVGGSDASGAAASASLALPSQHGPAAVTFGVPSKSPRAGSNARDGRARSGNSGSILDRATPRGQGWGTAGISAGGHVSGVGSSQGGGATGISPQPTRSPSPAQSEPIVIVRPFAWQERETRHWLEDMGLLVNPADEGLPLLDNPLRNGLLLAALATRLVGSSLPAGVVTEPPRDMRSARTNILCALDHLGMLAAPWAPPPDAERRARAQAAAAELASTAVAASGGGAGSNGGASGAGSRSPSPSRNNPSGPTAGSSGIIAIKALGSAGRGYALRLKERQLRAGLGLVAEVESVLAGSPDSIWGLLNFIRLAIAPQYQYLRGSAAGAGPGGAAGGRPWGPGAGGESLRRAFDVRGGAGPDGTLGLGPAPAALAAAVANGGHATSRSGRPSPSRGGAIAAPDVVTEGGSHQQPAPPEGTPTLRGGRAAAVAGRSKIPSGPVADPRGSMHFTSSLSQIPAAPSPGGGGPGAQAAAHDSGLLYRPLWPQLASLPYSSAELVALESSLLQWLMESGAISRREAAQGFPALLRMFEDGTFICWLVSNLSGKPIVGAHRRPLTEAARRTNWLKAIEALRTTPGMSRRFLVYEEALIHCERPPLTGLLEDLHRLAGGLPPAPSAILPDAKPYLPYAVPEPDVRTLPPDRIAINRGSPSASPRPASPTPRGRPGGPDPPSRRSTASPSPRATPSRHRQSGGLISNAGIASAGDAGGASTPAPPPSSPLAAAPHLLHPLFLKAVPMPSYNPGSLPEHATGHGGQASGRDDQGGEGAGGGASARGESPVRNPRPRSGGAVTAASGVRRATAVSDVSSGGASGAVVRSLITDIMVTPTKVAPAAAAGPSDMRRRQRPSSSTSIDLLRASYPAAAWGAESDLSSEAQQQLARNKRNHVHQNSHRQQQQQRGRSIRGGSRSAGGAAEGSPVYSALSPRLRLVPSGF